jgi:DNA-binding SARP family transcriptional activator
MDDRAGSRGSGLVVHVLGRPRIERFGEETYRFRSRKTWALLVYLLLGERPPGRAHVASLLFGEADDPLRALRWSLAEVRRGLGDDGGVDGDPLVLRLDPGVTVDASVVARGSWVHAVALPGLGSELLDGADVRSAPVFESWLLSARQRLTAASEAILHEAALGSMSRGALDEARGFALRAAAMSPLDENHQALVIRLYRLAGDARAAEQQYDAFARLLAGSLGEEPGPGVEAARRTPPDDGGQVADGTAIEAITESGSAAVSAGSADAGIRSLRTAVRLADLAPSESHRVRTRLVLAEALIHFVRGLDEEGLSALHEADRIAVARDDAEAVAQARAELGYVDFLRARYDRAELWLTEALSWAHGSLPVTAKATTYLGCVESDRASYDRAVLLLEEAVRLSGVAGDRRRAAYGLSMLGRVALLRGDLEAADAHLTASIRLTEADHWLAFLPWPQALLGELQLARGELGPAAGTLTQAFARARQLADPCWEGMAARGLGLAAEARGDTVEAFALLADAQARCTRHDDPYVWLEVSILDARCALGRRHGHPETSAWVGAMRELASRAGMRELMVRAMLHAAALGSSADGEAARLLAADVANPALADLVAAAG